MFKRAREFRAEGLGFRAGDLRFRVWESGLGFPSCSLLSMEFAQFVCRWVFIEGCRGWCLVAFASGSSGQSRLGSLHRLLSIR